MFRVPRGGAEGEARPDAGPRLVVAAFRGFSAVHERPFQVAEDEVAPFEKRPDLAEQGRAVLRGQDVFREGGPHHDVADGGDADRRPLRGDRGGAGTVRAAPRRAASRRRCLPPGRARQGLEGQEEEEEEEEEEEKAAVRFIRISYRDSGERKGNGPPVRGGRFPAEGGFTPVWTLGFMLSLKTGFFEMTTSTIPARHAAEM